MASRRACFRVGSVGLLAFVLAVLPPVFGCASKRTSSYPPAPPISSSALTANTAKSSQIAKPTVDSLAAAFTTPGKQPERRNANILVLSGGGQYAAYNAGLLIGWTDAGTRPTFDVVTGISSGAIVAGYSFLGQKYDPQLQRFFTTIRDKDLFTYRPVIELIRNGSLANPRRLEKMIETEVNECYLFDLREAHKEGRRLYIGTMNLQTRRLCIWDVGAIACSERPDAAELVRKVFLAAGSIPGLLPSVKFDVEVDGQRFTEEHVDGGAACQAFLRLAPGMERPPNGKDGWLKGSNMYVMAAGKLYADPLTEKPGFIKRVTSTISAALYALFRAELMGMYAFGATSGMKFHMIAIPQEVDAPPNSMTFQPVEMRKLFQLGYDSAQQGIQWRLTPPGTEPGEEEAPRDVPPLFQPVPVAPGTAAPVVAVPNR